jgi:hypothetical protein
MNNWHLRFDTPQNVCADFNVNSESRGDDGGLTPDKLIRNNGVSGNSSLLESELAKKSRKDLGQCHPKEIEFRTRATNGFRLPSSLKAMPQQSNTS